MAIAAPQWTKPLPISQQRSDPSGASTASTEYQADLLSGMSTQTGRARYISLFAMARGFHTAAGQRAEHPLAFTTLLRRLEALIGVCTVRHHQGEATPTGIIGSGDSRALATRDEITLALKLTRPAYDVYFGPLAALGLFDDVNYRRDEAPLYQGARPLAESWDAAAAGPLGAALAKGTLPERVPRAWVDEHAAAFCLCRVPSGSAEETALVRRFFALDAAQAGDATENDLRRSASWRLLLELVRRTPQAKLENRDTIIRLLQPDLAALAGEDDTLSPRLRQSLIHWRWVAARTLMEHGWTHAFMLAFQRLLGTRDGFGSSELRAELGQGFDDTGGLLAEFDAEVRARDESAAWLAERFAGGSSLDGLALLLAGLHHAMRDRARYDDREMDTLWSAGDIPFKDLAGMVDRAIQRGEPASGLWADVGETSLAEHMRISLRKMSTGLPDSLIVDFDDQRWLVPAKARTVPLYPARAYTRLDTALWWAREIGLVTSTPSGVNTLTSAADAICAEWDEVHGA